jgi:hypothetical protein
VHFGGYIYIYIYFVVYMCLDVRVETLVKLKGKKERQKHLSFGMRKGVFIKVDAADR